MLRRENEQKHREGAADEGVSGQAGSAEANSHEEGDSAMMKGEEGGGEGGRRVWGGEGRRGGQRWGGRGRHRERKGTKETNGEGAESKQRGGSLTASSLTALESFSQAYNTGRCPTSASGSTLSMGPSQLETLPPTEVLKDVALLMSLSQLRLSFESTWEAQQHRGEGAALAWDWLGRGVEGGQFHTMLPQDSPISHTNRSSVSRSSSTISVSVTSFRGFVTGSPSMQCTFCKPRSLSECVYLICHQLGSKMYGGGWMGAFTVDHHSDGILPGRDELGPSFGGALEDDVGNMGSLDGGDHKAEPQTPRTNVNMGPDILQRQRNANFQT